MPILEKNSDFADSNYFTALQTRILLYAQKQDLKMVEKYSEELSAEIERQLHNVFPYLTERQRMDFWNQLSGWSSFTLPFLTVAYQTEGLKKECYNSILQSRGILLNSTLNIDRILRNTDDVLLKELYQQWKTAKQGKMNTDIIDELEKKIMEKLPSQGDFLADMSINTDSIRKYLSDKDIAIGFFSVLDPEVEDTIYAALTLKKRYPEPYIVTLCRSGEVYASLSESFCNTELYNLFWKQLEGEMKGVDRVFFAVDGVLHNIPIEYCPDENGSSMFDKYECYRVSSTREIAKNGGSKDDNQIVDFDKSLTKGNIVMYGDIDYNTYGDEDENNGRKAYKDNSYESNAEPADSICADTLEVQEIQSKEYRSIVRGNRFALESFKPLDGTRKELQSIEQMLRTNGIIPIVKTKETATEGSFYDLSEKPLQWLHFATHGYYESEEAVSEFGPMADVDNVVGSPEAMALSRAALVFSGANNWVEMGEKDGGGHDGLLTAYEMSSQDFSNIDMVVMSACESGLGDIGSEGVLGLQRGMKKAGAKSLLMSLCKVDDDATVLFMETFYKALLNKQNKLRALSEAQKAVREEKNGKWSSPQYWASFILLDGF